ncbi:dihydrofolate reductase family protein [Cohnella zeiphila]|uniref:Dihydrofolate reductase family protein n=1 Tax=Cohnella zeiphila TaxID=2761120 RepID=A0A7X0VWP0_9BACL|nr:dihydrofolate reductase family protein [Cohnella zeiphila]MBB6733419.1 dihydrofolate reductase family protein [Cohnella zeiphila]
MSKVVVIEHLTLDGVMQGPARPDEDTRNGFEYGGWGAEAGNDPVMLKVLGASMGSSWSLLVGRTTYEDFFKIWPNQPKPNPFTEALNNVEKFVASTTLSEPLPWRNSTLLKGDAADAVAKLKKELDKNLVVFGSGVLVQSLMKRNLIDEYVLQIHPLVLGKGRRLFLDGSPITHLRLVDSVTTGTGVMIATYRPSTC